MTRINADLDPTILADQHLMAEYREITMVTASLRRSLRTQSAESIIKKIPKTFTLNKGHVTFFYDKLKFLQDRYNLLVNELKHRGYKLTDDRKFNIESLPVIFYNDWKATDSDREIIKQRIKIRLESKIEWYKYYGESLNSNRFLKNYN